MGLFKGDGNFNHSNKILETLKKIGDPQNRSAQNLPVPITIMREIKKFLIISRSLRCWNIYIVKINNSKYRGQLDQIVGIKI